MGGGGEECGKQEKFSVFIYKSETCCWTKKLNKNDYGVDKSGYFFLLEKSKQG